jgi:hypothetical protein
MFINGLALYKVVEFRNGVIIINALDAMPNRPEAVELIVADIRTCGEYLLRYLHARGDGAAGGSMERAHKQALEGAIVTKSWEGQ